MNLLTHSATHTAAEGATSSGNSGLPSSAGLNNMFLQLLVAQLQNQSPLDPMDPTQFVGQLAEFSQLSEITQIDQLLQQALSSHTSSAESGTGSPSAHNTKSLPPTPEVSSVPAAAGSVIPKVAAPASAIANSQIQGVL